LASIIAAPHNPPLSGGLCGGGATPRRFGFCFETTTEATLAALVRSYDHVPIAMSNDKNGILLFFSK
jgi:hypothetical protein